MERASASQRRLESPLSVPDNRHEDLRNEPIYPIHQLVIQLLPEMKRQCQVLGTTLQTLQKIAKKINTQEASAITQKILELQKNMETKIDEIPSCSNISVKIFHSTIEKITKINSKILKIQERLHDFQTETKKKYSELSEKEKNQFASSINKIEQALQTFSRLTTPSAKSLERGNRYMEEITDEKNRYRKIEKQLEERITNLQNEMNRLSQQHAQEHQKSTSQEKQIQESQQDIQRMNEEILKLTELNEEQYKKNKEIENLREQAKQKEEEYLKAQQEISALHTQLNAEQASRQEQKEKVQQLKSKITEMEKAQNEKAEEIESLLEKLEHVEEEMDQAQTAIQRTSLSISTTNEREQETITVTLKINKNRMKMLAHLAIGTLLFPVPGLSLYHYGKAFEYLEIQANEF